MLKRLYLKNYILIDELDVEFDDGLNVITGETGAGKSIMINAIDIVFSPRVSKEVIKKDRATIELTISSETLSEFLRENDIDDIGEEIVISKEISQSAVKTRINGTLVTQDVVAALREKILDIHSQHQTYQLLMPKSHIKFLDNYSHDIYGELLCEYRKLYEEYKMLCSELERAKDAANVTENQIEFLKFQINEIEQANIEDENEYDNLREELSVLENAERLKELAYSSHWALSGDDNSIMETLSKIRSNLSKAVSMDKNITDIEESFINAVDMMQEVSSDLERYALRVENDTQRLDEIQERLFVLDKLRRKYGSTLFDVLTTYENLKTEFEQIEFSSKNIEELEIKISKILKELNSKADKLSQYRRNSDLGEKIVQELTLLDLPKVRFEVSVEDAPLSKDGKDKVEFLISTNVSEDLKSLSKVASGGEISRVMLAIKSILANSDDIDTVIFDEIDTGISGKASQSVADELEKLSKSHQIIVITHQPIIASKSDRHFHVKKSQSEQTQIEVNVLTLEEKINAIAELASGEVTEQSLTFARSLVE